MKSKSMKILIIEDDIIDCENFKKSAELREDIEIVGITASDIEGLKYVKIKHPEGIVLDLELNNSPTGNVDALDFLANLKDMNLNFTPIIIVTTHINSRVIYDKLHKSGVDLILYKDQPKYSADYVLNKFISLRSEEVETLNISITDELKTKEEKISDLIFNELDLVGITSNLKGRQYLHDAILYLIEHENSDINVMVYLSNIHKRSENTINNGIKNAIHYAWRKSPVEDLTVYYTARIDYETGVPTPMEFIYYYVDKIRKLI